MVKGSDLYVDVDVVDVGKENDNKAFGNSDLTLIRELDFHLFPTLYLVCVCVYIHVSGVSFKTAFFSGSPSQFQISVDWSTHFPH